MEEWYCGRLMIFCTSFNAARYLLISRPCLSVFGNWPVPLDETIIVVAALRRATTCWKCLFKTSVFLELLFSGLPRVSLGVLDRHTSYVQSSWSLPVLLAVTAPDTELNGFCSAWTKTSLAPCATCRDSFSYWFHPVSLAESLKQLGCFLTETNSLRDSRTFDFSGCVNCVTKQL